MGNEWSNEAKKYVFQVVILSNYNLHV